MMHQYSFGKPNIKRTHEITINSAFYSKDTKTFSLWCPPEYDSDKLREIITDIINTIENYIPNYLALETNYNSKYNKKTHIIIIKPLNSEKHTKSKKVKLPTLTSEDIGTMLARVFGTTVKGGQK